MQIYKCQRQPVAWMAWHGSGRILKSGSIWFSRYFFFFYPVKHSIKRKDINVKIMTIFYPTLKSMTMIKLLITRRRLHYCSLLKNCCLMISGLIESHQYSSWHYHLRWHWSTPVDVVVNQGAKCKESFFTNAGARSRGNIHSVGRWRGADTL